MNEKYIILTTIIILAIVFTTFLNTKITLVAQAYCSRVIENTSWANFYNMIWGNATIIGELNISSSHAKVYYVNMSNKYFYELYTGPSCKMILHEVDKPNTNTWQATVSSTLRQGKALAYVLGGTQISPYEYIPYTKILFNTASLLIIHSMFIESSRGLAIPTPIFMELIGNKSNAILVIDIGFTKTIDLLTNKTLDSEKLRFIAYNTGNLMGFQILKYTYRYVYENKSIITLEANEVMVYKNNTSQLIIMASSKISYETMQPLIMGHILLVSPKLNLSNASIMKFIERIAHEYNIILKKGVLMVQLMSPLLVRNKTSPKLSISENDYMNIIKEFVKLYNKYTPLLLADTPILSTDDINGYLVVGLANVVDSVKNITGLLEHWNNANTLNATINMNNTYNVTLKNGTSTNFSKSLEAEILILALIPIFILVLITLVKTKFRRT